MKKRILIFAVIICACLPGAHAARNSADLAAVNAQLKKAESESKVVEKKVKESDKNVEKTKKELVSAAAKVDKLEIERANLRKKIDELEAKQERLATSVKQNKSRLSDSASGLLVISSNPSFNTDDMREYVLTSALLTGMATQFDADVVRAENEIKELERVAAEKREQQEKLEATAKKYEKDKSYLDGLLKTRTAQNEKLRKSQYELQEKLRDLSARAKNLSELTAGLSTEKVSADASFSRRKLKSPVSGKLVSIFGEKSALGLISDGWRIRTRSGALVMAPADGRVDFADNFKGYGRVVILSHKNSYHTVLTGLDFADVLVGQEVLAGEPIGRMPDRTTEMYMELRRGTKAVDPARLFNEP